MDEFDEMIEHDRRLRFERLEKALETLLLELTAHPNVPVSVQLAAGHAQNVLRGVE